MSEINSIEGIIAPERCKCDLCVNYDMYRWATIIECKCACHKSNGPSGHDSLCCEFPNGKAKDNPHKELKPASQYEK